MVLFPRLLFQKCTRLGFCEEHAENRQCWLVLQSLDIPHSKTPLQSHRHAMCSYWSLLATVLCLCPNYRTHWSHATYHASRRILCIYTDSTSQTLSSSHKHKMIRRTKIVLYVDTYAPIPHQNCLGTLSRFAFSCPNYENFAHVFSSSTPFLIVETNWAKYATTIILLSKREKQRRFWTSKFLM